MSRYELDIKNLEKFPAPPIPDWFARDLAGLLPLNPYNEPQLIVGWGPDLTCFRNGNPKAIKYIAIHELIKTAKWRRLDPIAGAYEYFDTRHEAVNALNIRLLPQREFRITRSVRLWGPPRFIVEQWMPPERLDNPRSWERNRYASYLNRRGEKIGPFDALGPYPSRGQYREVFTVEDADGGFRGLDQLVMSDIRRRVKEREIYGYNDYTDEQEILNANSAADSALALEEAEIEDEFMQSIGPSKYRLVEGNAFVGSGGNAAAQARRVSTKP